MFETTIFLTYLNMTLSTLFRIPKEIFGYIRFFFDLCGKHGILVIGSVRYLYCFDNDLFVDYCFNNYTNLPFEKYSIEWRLSLYVRLVEQIVSKKRRKSEHIKSRSYLTWCYHAPKGDYIYSICLIYSIIISWYLEMMQTGTWNMAAVMTLQSFTSSSGEWKTVIMKARVSRDAIVSGGWWKTNFKVQCHLVWSCWQFWENLNSKYLALCAESLLCMDVSM